MMIADQITLELLGMKRYFDLYRVNYLPDRTITWINSQSTILYAKVTLFRYRIVPGLVQCSL